MPLLDVCQLTTQFATRQGWLTAVDRVSFQIEAGETLALVGESGCGKSVTAASILRLLPNPPARIAGGEILFEGRDLLKLPIQDMRAVRGNRIGMVFQDPMTSLNPVFTAGDQICESIRVHQSMPRAKARRRALDLLSLVGIPDPPRVIGEYPHRLSGGMRQRVMIAMALACDPALLIADEPTTALDVTTQAQILELIDDLKQRLGMAVLLITHDLGLVAQTAQRVLVMYAGRVVEQAEVEQLLGNPLHPYTRGLLQSLPRPEALDDAGRPLPLAEIAGMPPSLAALPKGCRFAPRCAYVRPICEARNAPLTSKTGGRSTACLRVDEMPWGSA